MERGGLIIGAAILPTPREEADPCAREGPHSGLMGCPLVTLLLSNRHAPSRRAGSMQPPMPHPFVGGMWGTGGASGPSIACRGVR